MKSVQHNAVKNHMRKKIKKDGLQLLFMVVPFVIFVFIFSYLPLFGWIYAFFDYRPGLALKDMVFRC